MSCKSCKPKPIPKLGDTATAVLNAALAFPNAGYSIVFSIVGIGEYRLDANGYLNETIWKGNIPLIGEILKPERLIEDISKGYVTITVQSPGREPHFFREIHRATGTTIPIE